MNHNNKPAFAGASLKMLVDSMDSMVDKSRRTESLVAPVTDFLYQLSFPEVKAIYFIVQVGRNPSWLEESRSIAPLYENLSGIRPASEGKQSCIDFLLPKFDSLQTYFSRYFEVCNKLGLDPLKDLEFLIHDELAQHH